MTHAETWHEERDRIVALLKDASPDDETQLGQVKAPGTMDPAALRARLAELNERLGEPSATG